MRKPNLALFGLSAALVFTTPALAANLNRATEDWVYFHRQGATLADHNAAVASCLTAARRMGAPYTGGGLLGAVISGAAHDSAIAPGVENCMVSTGWEVVRLEEAEGSAIGALDQPGQSKALALWVGSETVHGVVVRRFEPLAHLTAVKGLGGVFGGRLALSVTAAPPSPATPPRKYRLQNLPESDPTKAPPGSGFIVIRLITHALPNAGYNLARFNEPEGTIEAVGAVSPVKLFMKTGADLEKTFILAVPPGRWHFASPIGVDLCLGAPAFDIAVGEVLFAGTFTVGSADPLQPEMSLEPAKAAMKDADLKARLRAAPWTNGNRHDCGAIPNELYPYRLDFAGFPSLPENPQPG